MQTRAGTTSNNHHHQDRGFTLVELLIVIVILGILATVTVFAVRGITDKGQDNAEATDLRSLETAAEAYYAQNGTNPPDEATLGDPALGLMKGESELHDYVLNGDGTYTITNVRTGLAVGTGAAAGGGGGGGGSAFDGTATTIGGVPGVVAGDDAAQVLMIGSGSAIAAWNAEIASGEDISGIGVTITMVDIADVADLEALIIAADTAGYMEVGEIVEDNVAAYCNVPGPGDLDLDNCIAWFVGDNGLAISESGYSSGDFSGWFS